MQFSKTPGFGSQSSTSNAPVTRAVRLGSVSRLAVAGCGAHPRENSLGDIRGGVEGRELEFLLLAEVNRDQRVQPIQQLLECVDIRDICCLQTLDPGDDRLVIVDIGTAASANPTSSAHSG